MDSIKESTGDTVSPVHLTLDCRSSSESLRGFLYSLHAAGLESSVELLGTAVPAGYAATVNT